MIQIRTSTERERKRETEFMSFREVLVLFNNKEHHLNQFLCLFRLDHPTTVDGEETQPWKACLSYCIFFLVLPFFIFRSKFKAFMINHLFLSPALSLSFQICTTYKKLGTLDNEKSNRCAKTDPQNGYTSLRHMVIMYQKASGVLS